MNKNFQYFLKVLVIFCLFHGQVEVLYAQTPETPEILQQEDILPDSDPLKVDRFNVEFLIVEGMHFLAIENQAKALESFLKAHQIMPENAALNYKIAEIFKASEETDQALLYISNATEKEKDNHYYQSLKAEILTAQGDLPGAIATYEDLYKFAEDAPDDYLLELAALYLYNEEPYNALKTYDRIEKRLGILEEVSIQKQKIYLQQNKLKEALIEGKNLVNAYPKVGGYAVSVAQILVSNNKILEAIEYLENYLIEHPNQAEAHLELGKLYRQSNQIDLALVNFTTAFHSEEISLESKLNEFIALIRKSLTPTYTNKFKELGETIIEVHNTEANAFAAFGDLFIELDQKDSAQFFYEKAVALNGDNLQLWQNILSLELENNNFQQAAEYSEEAITYFPNQPILYLFGGSAYYALKEFKKAIMLWEQGKSMVFGNDRMKSSFAAQLADAYHANKDYKKAFETYEEAIKLNPENYFAVNNFAYYLSLRKQNLERAKELSSIMVKANPNNANFLDTHGWVLFQKGEYEKALTVLEKAVKLQASGTIIEHYADALFKLGKKEEALQQWKRAKMKGGASDLIDKKISEKQYYEASI
ncbi:tetratricopeptide repeat protein [Marivirga sp.]|uniref:tetratricopeptide repeat protein n=1 Tax=Marivirga sp. TaxID=2018662 RepID=UPI002D804A7C|nr:tetratricopeptide repeat protein [Marivirga sp.]HET8860775.1 tetratricopeptide repeat protein [Marivirga sp.]